MVYLPTLKYKLNPYLKDCPHIIPVLASMRRQKSVRQGILKHWKEKCLAGKTFSPLFSPYFVSRRRRRAWIRRFATKSYEKWDQLNFQAKWHFSLGIAVSSFRQFPNKSQLIYSLFLSNCAQLNLSF